MPIPIRHADAITRRESVPEDKRTPARDACADWIDSEIVETGRWPMDYSAIADLSQASESVDGWSRQHIANTLEAYFVPDIVGLSRDEMWQRMLSAYRLGYSDGFDDGRRH